MIIIVQARSACDFSPLYHIQKKALLSAGPKGNKKGRDADYFIGYEKDI